MLPNIPAAANLWDFAKVTGLGITWAYGRYTFGYRTDMIDAPIKIIQRFLAAVAGRQARHLRHRQRHCR